ncbi:uncharacterized protein LOC6561155 [Drosophila grimshawi]|uniref:GH20115 n=1 Tax=Drosophila grimshawi TaxID=7222 RepID=B4J6W2_DROGR|nr:uncharacterized protein LOC6561155 [Drosophila grimshawi]EDW02043.1 GH20115 [Drosophila grimshawi]
MDDRVGSYQRARRKFSSIVYGVTLIWLLLALIQWLVINLMQNDVETYLKYEWISLIFFFLSIILVFVFIFVEKSRFITGLSWIITILSVEFAIIGLFALVVKPMWPELLLWFAICVILLFISVLLGAFIPHDLTLDIVVLFVVSFVFLIASIFLIMLHLLTQTLYSYILFELLVTSIILMFIMYHGQTINGGRFAEMRINDYLLGTVILFYDFIIIFLLSFYMQTHYQIVKHVAHPEEPLKINVKQN